MGTEKTSTNIKKIDCDTCGREYSPMCDYLQGRCPYHPSMLDKILSDPYKSRFYNLLKFFKGK